VFIERRYSLPHCLLRILLTSNALKRYINSNRLRLRSLKRLKKLEKRAERLF
jgi:hypothetical protein